MNPHTNLPVISKLAKVNVEKLIEFVSLRRVSGGFAFWNPLLPSLPKTYYSIYILKSAGVEVSEKEELIEFLENSIKKELYSIFYTFSSLTLLGEEVEEIEEAEELPDVSDFLIHRLDNAMGRYRQIHVSAEPSGTTATYSFDLPNILREVYLATTSLKLLGKKIPDKAINFIKSFRKCGFGTTSPNLEETYFCVSVLGRIEIESRGELISFIKEHECAGGFTKTPAGYPPYLEDTYYALSCFNILGYRYANEKTRSYISSLQNSNGGFRRSIYGGISSLEYSYHAVASLNQLKST